nr:14416_t:CDS:2 [Entrophospora candida]
MYNCQDDIRYWIPSNSSTVTVPYDPKAITIQEVGDACEVATNLALVFYLIDYVLKVIFLIHYGRVVHSYSKVLFEEKIDNGEDHEIGKIDDLEDDKKKNDQNNDAILSTVTTNTNTINNDSDDDKILPPSLTTASSVTSK